MYYRIIKRRVENRKESITMINILLFLLFISCNLFGMQQNGNTDMLSKLPLELRAEINNIIIENSNPEQAGQALRNLQATSKDFKNYIDSDIQYIVKQFAKKFKVAEPLASLYIGTVAAVDIFNAQSNKLTQEELSKMFDQIMAYSSSSKQSKAIKQELVIQALHSLIMSAETKHSKTLMEQLTFFHQKLKVQSMRKEQNIIWTKAAYFIRWTKENVTK